MRKLFITIIAIVVYAVGMMAEDFEVVTIDGKKYNGELVSRTDSTITIFNRNSLNKYCFHASELREATSAQNSRFTVIDGKIVGMSHDEVRMQMKQKESERMGDPNYAIGKAFKSTGSIALGLGVPCFVVGTILYASGRSFEPDAKSTLKDAQKYSDLQVSGAILMGMGGSLTLLGIPLYVHGKKITDLSIQIAEEGAKLVVAL